MLTCVYKDESYSLKRDSAWWCGAWVEFFNMLPHGRDDVVTWICSWFSFILTHWLCRGMKKKCDWFVSETLVTQIVSKNNHSPLRQDELPWGKTGPLKTREGLRLRNCLSMILLNVFVLFSSQMILFFLFRTWLTGRCSYKAWRVVTGRHERGLALFFHRLRSDRK